MTRKKTTPSSVIKSSERIKTPNVIKTSEGVDEHKGAPPSLFSRHWFMPRFCLSPSVQYCPKANGRATHAMEQKKIKKAAVLIPLVERKGELFILFTKRASHLSKHPGQISFPGGKAEKSDQNSVATALREMKEEIGISTSKENLIGCLPPLPTVSGYLVTPVIAFICPNDSPKLDANEVESFFEVPLSKFMSPNSMFKHPFLFQGKKTYIYATTHQEHLIWGLTAQILNTLIELLSAYQD